MGLSTLHNVRFAGMSSCVPRRVLHNIEDAPPRLRSERERLVRNIGIQNRRICPEWQTFSDLAFEATGQLLASLAWERDEIDAIIVVTQSPDYITPATAVILQDRLGLQHTTIAFDINLGCSAYPFGLHVLGCMIASGGVRKGLLLVGDRCATLEEPLFSDAGTCTALEFDETAPPMFFDLNSDGSGHKAIIQPVGGHREPIRLQHLVPTRENPDAPWKFPGAFQLDGPAVLSFSTQHAPASVRKVLEYARIDIGSVDYFVFHQANRMINETIRKKLALPPEKVPTTLLDFGNTSGASLPVTMTVRIREQLLAGPKRMVLCGFGIGLSWGTCIVDIANAHFTELLES